MWYLLALLILSIITVLYIQVRRTRAQYFTPLGARQHPAKNIHHAALRRFGTDRNSAMSCKRRRKRIQNQIESLQLSLQNCNYSTAEAVLNRAIHQNPTQYELYLNLLDLHLSQPNRLASEKLISHIQQLNHPELFKQAKQKYFAIFAPTSQSDTVQHRPTLYEFSVVPFTNTLKPFICNEISPNDAQISTQIFKPYLGKEK